MRTKQALRLSTMLAISLCAPAVTLAQVANGPPPGTVPTLDNSWRLAMSSIVASNLCTFFLAQGGGVTPAQGNACLTAQRLAGTANGTAIRIAAPEELSATNSLLKELAHRQLNQLNQRLTHGQTTGTGGMLAQLPLFASLDPQAMAADTGGLSKDFGRWGVFGNLAHDFGSGKATDLADGFNLSGFNLTGGADYRLKSSWVTGAIAGYSDERARFDTTSSTGGRLGHKGYSLLAFSQYEGAAFYATVSVGLQRLDERLERSGTYIDPVNTDAGGNNLRANFVATGSTNISATFATLQSGYAWNKNALTLEPYLQLQYRHNKVDAFTETGASGVVSNAGGSYPFELNIRYAAASITSFDGTLGFKLQRVVNGANGVFVPYFTAEYTHQFNDTPYAVSGMLAPLSGIVPDFTLPANALSGHFYTAMAGCSYVAQGGLQAFLQLRSSFSQANLSDRAITVGIRHEL